MAVKNLLSLPDRRLGYALAAAKPDAKYVMYAEGSLPKNRQARIASDAAFADLDYALYLGKTPTTSNLLGIERAGWSARDGTRRGSEAVPFGQSQFLLVMAPQGSSAGRCWRGCRSCSRSSARCSRWARRCWSSGWRGVAKPPSDSPGCWAKPRIRTRACTPTNGHIAQTLQHSLLPERLPGVPGVVAVGRYEAGVSGLEVGGDWYDVLPVGPHRLLFSVGDVCGRGLAAAAAMAALRFSIRAYAVEGDLPAEILAKLSRLVLARAA